MEYERAREIVANNQHLIGQTINGGRIDDLVIYPTDRNSHDEFIRSYVISRNAATAIRPFTNQDVEVYAIIDSGRINTQGFYMHSTLREIGAEHQVNI